MELVKGAPLTKYCDEHRLTPKERLELFIPVCQAIQHAHQKGIIHRDIKPSNVLVALYDGKPVPKVIDFGVAKATGQQLTEHTLVTGFGAVVGTLEYMSPEQAELNQLDIDTRSDIYSLGVLLYELLTGSTPLQKKRLKEAALLEVLRVIREEEPPRPSTRLSTTDELPSVAANRGLEPKKLSGIVRGELDWIVMKALEKDRNRRYETANSLAMDILRYLNDEPVQACPPSGWYRFRKFARRNKAGFALAGLILFFIVLLGGGSGWVIRDRAARRAQTATDMDRALRDAQALQEQRKWPEALALVKHAQALLTSGGDEDLRQQVRDRVADLEMMVKVEDARLRWSTVKGDSFDFEESEAAYAKAFREYGVDIEALDPKAAGTLLQARDIRVELAAALDGWARVLRRQGKSIWKDRLAAARAADPDLFRDRVREAVARGDRKALEKLAEDNEITDLPPPTLDLMAQVLGSQQAVALVSKALRQHPEDFWFNLLLANYLEKMQPAPLEEVIRYTSVAKALRPQSAIPYFKLGRALVEKGRADEAIAEWSEAIRLQDNALTRYNLGLALFEKRRLDEAEAHYRQAILLKKDYAEAHTGLGNVLSWQNKLDEAIAEYRQAIRLKKDYADAYTGLGGALKEQGKLDKAIAQYRLAISIKDDAAPHVGLGNAFFAKGQMKAAIAEYSKAIEKSDSAEARTGLGAALASLNRLDEAIEEHKRALKIKKDCAEAHLNLGFALMGKRLLGEAIKEFREAARLAPKSAEVHANLGVALQENGDLEEAIKEHRLAIDLKKNDPGMHNNLAIALAASGRMNEAIAVLDKAVKSFPESPEVHNGLAWYLATCADAKFRDPARAVEAADKAVKLASANPDYWGTLGTARYRAKDWKGCIAALQECMTLKKGGDAYSWFFLAMARWQLGDKEQARQSFDQAVQWMDKNAQQNEELRRFRAEAAELLGAK